MQNYSPRLDLLDRGHSLSNAEETSSTCAILAVHVPTSARLTIRESTTHVARISEHVFVAQTDMINNSTLLSGEWRILGRQNWRISNSPYQNLVIPGLPTIRGLEFGKADIAIRIESQTVQHPGNISAKWGMSPTAMVWLIEPNRQRNKFF